MNSDANTIREGTRLGAKTLLGGLFMTFFVPSIAYMFVAVIELKESNAILAHELPKLTSELKRISVHMIEHEKEIPKFREWKAAVDFEIEYILKQCEQYYEDIEQCKNITRAIK